jgi:hypothetical protein
VRSILTVNRPFMRAFLDATPPCFALGMVEERRRQYGLLAIRPAAPIPVEVTEIGFNFGHALYGSTDFEVIHFVFAFYGFQTYNVLINPNNPLVQRVLHRLLADGDYFFFALEATGRVTTFRTAIGQDTLSQVQANLARIEQSTTTEAQYRRALASFAAHPEPEGILLEWVCRDTLDYLDLTHERLELTRRKCIG